LILADRVPIPIPYIVLREPSQLAIVAWNDGKEILILTTQLYFPKFRLKNPSRVRVLEIIPLPSEAKVEAGSVLIFYKLLKLLKQGMSIYRTGVKAPTGVEVIFKEVIGPHKIALIKAESADDVVEWLVEYARSLGVTLNVNLTNLKLAIDDYIKREFKYFAIDVIDLKQPIIETQRLGYFVNIMPLIYKFNSPRLYYPLKITRAGVKGWTSIKLFLVTSTRINKSEIEALGFKVISEVVVNASDLFKVCDKFESLFERYEKLWITVIEYSGSLDELVEDLWILPSSPAENTALQMLLLSPTLISLILVVYFLLRSRREGVQIDKLVIAVVLIEAVLVINFVIPSVLVLIREMVLMNYGIVLIIPCFSSSLYIASAILGVGGIVLLFRRSRNGYMLTLFSCFLGITTLVLLISTSFLDHAYDFFRVGSRLVMLLTIIGGIALPLELGNIVLIGWKFSKEIKSSESSEN